MLEVALSDPTTGKRIRHDLHALKLDGQLAHQLDADKLYRRLKGLGVSVTTDLGKQALLLAYSKFLLKQKEATDREELERDKARHAERIAKLDA